jgi:hypothetical protein
LIIKIKTRFGIMKLSEIAIERLKSQHLSVGKHASPDDVVSWLGAVQAQDYYGAKWSVGLRLSGITDEEVENALKTKKILRTWGNRGTLQFISTRDVGLFLKLMAPRIISRNAKRYRELGLDEKTLSKSEEVLINALKGSKGIKRTELQEILEQNGVSTEGQRTAFILQRASLDGLIHQSVSIKNTPVYHSMEDLHEKELNMEDSLKEISKRYFYSHGPATLKDFVWWSGLTVKDAKSGLQSIKHLLKPENIHGKEYWSKPTKLSMEHRSPVINLLPIFDDLLLGYQDRGASIDIMTRKLLRNKYGMFSPTIIVDGVVTGTWKRFIKGDNVIFRPKLFRKLDEQESDALNLEIIRYSEFLDKKLIIEK